MTQFLVVLHLGVDSVGFLHSETGFSHLHCDGYIAVIQGAYGVVEVFTAASILNDLGFLFVRRSIVREAEIVKEVVQFLGEGNGLNNLLHPLQGLLQLFTGRLESTLEHFADFFFGEAFNLALAVGVVLDSALDEFEEFPVINDITKLLFSAIYAVYAADGLEEVMVHDFAIQVQVCGRRCVKTGEQFVHDDEEFHFSRTVDELVLGPGFILFRGAVSHHLFGPLVFVLLFGLLTFVCKAVGERDVRDVTGHYSAVILEVFIAEKVPIFVCLVNAFRNQHGVAVPICESVTQFHIQHDISNYTAHTVVAAVDVLQLCPAVF